MWRVDYRELHEGYRVARFNEVFKRKIHLHSNSNIILSINCSKHTTDSFSSQQMLGFKYTRKESPQKTEFTEEVMGLTSTYFFPHFQSLVSSQHAVPEGYFQDGQINAISMYKPSYRMSLLLKRRLI